MKVHNYLVNLLIFQNILMSNSSKILSKRGLRRPPEDLTAKPRFIIGNLDHYIKMFQDCLIHLINYEGGVDFPNYDIPVVISRYTYIRLSVHSKYQLVVVVPFEQSELDLKLNTSRQSRDDYKFIERRSNYNLPCRAQFYILPEKLKLKKWRFIIPRAFDSFWMG